MNRALAQSIAYANQRNYLDELYRVYPIIPEGIRDVDSDLWHNVEVAFQRNDNYALVEALLKMELFPVKDSYVAYLRHDSSALQRNPQTINRIAGRLRQIGLDKIFENCTQPKETNRQIGPMFKEWVGKGELGLFPVPQEEFVTSTENAILDASDAEMKAFATEHLNYQHKKGLDFLARFNGKYVIGEAKFLTDFGGHQNAQFNDAISTISTPHVKAIKIAILDGVLYIPGRNTMYKGITETYREANIMSALVLRDFLYSL